MLRQAPAPAPLPPLPPLLRRPSSSASSGSSSSGGSSPPLSRLSSASAATSTSAPTTDDGDGDGDASPRQSQTLALSLSAEREAAAVLREQLARERRVTSDDVRYVVRVLASRGGRRPLPADFPPPRWILDFRRRHALSTADGAAAAALLPARRPRDGVAHVTNSSVASSSDGEREAAASADADDGYSYGFSASFGGEQPSRRRRCYGYGYGYEFGGAAPSKMRYAVPSEPYPDDPDRALETAALSAHPPLKRPALAVPPISTLIERRAAAWPPSGPLGVCTGPPDVASLASRSGGKTGSSITSNSSDSSRAPGGPVKPWGHDAPPLNVAARMLQSKKSALADDSSSSKPQEDHQSCVSSISSTSEKRKYKLSHTVSPEVWEKAIAAVEQQGMSLRAAAKIYGVHFAALHRRVKKRAASGHGAKNTQGYFHPSDEAGIMRVVVARAELGVLMTFDELMELVETAALRKLPDISVSAARSLMLRFQTRNEHSIRHIIVDWPLPRVSPHIVAGDPLLAVSPSHSLPQPTVGRVGAIPSMTALAAVPL